MAAEPKVETGASFLTTPVTEAHFLTAEKLNEEQRDIFARMKKLRETL